MSLQLVESMLASFTPITLAEMEDVALMDRQDTKYLLSIEQLPQVLGVLKGDYSSLDVNGVRLGRYRSQYMDTPGLAFYLQHHNGLANRLKVRYREYIDSGISFLEIKRKTNKNRTEKKRIKVPGIPEASTDSELGFMQANGVMDPTAVVPTLSVLYRRATLVNQNTAERVTIDCGLSFHHPETGEDFHFPEMVIIEVKQPRKSRRTPVASVLESLNISPMSWSKYCLGLLTLDIPNKKNLFKHKLLSLSKILKNDRLRVLATTASLG